MIRRLVLYCAAAAALGGAACLDMSAPKGVASISAIFAPAPAAVVHDVLRDSTGAPAPLRVVAYDQNGDTIKGVTPSFFVLDRGAHVDSSGLFFGDSITQVRVVATIAGFQTPADTVIVTASPDTAVKVGPVDTLVVTVGEDSTKSTASVEVKLEDRTGAPARGFLVHYRLVYAPASADTMPTVYIGDDGLKPSLVDTTDASGAASRDAVLRLKALAGAPDSIVVEATATYKGLAVPGTPLRFVIPVRLGTNP